MSVWMCSNPKCNAVTVFQPDGLCPKCRCLMGVIGLVAYVEAGEHPDNGFSQHNAPGSRQGILDNSVRGFDRAIFRGTEARD